MGRAVDQYCHGAQISRASSILSEVDKGLWYLQEARSQHQLVLCTAVQVDHACFLPHRMLPLFANKMLEWSEGTIEFSSLLWGSDYIL